MNCLTFFTTACLCMTYNGVMSQEPDGITFTFRTGSIITIFNGTLLDLGSNDSIDYHLNQTILQRFYDCLCEDGSEICTVLGFNDKSNGRYEAAGIFNSEPRQNDTEIIYTYFCGTDLLNNTGKIRCMRNYVKQQTAADSSTCPTHQLDVPMTLCNSVVLYNNNSNFYSIGTQKTDSGCVALQANLDAPVPVLANDTNSNSSVATNETTASSVISTTVAASISLPPPTTTTEKGTAEYVTTSTITTTSTTPTTKVTKQITQSSFTNTITASQSTLSTEAESTSTKRTLSSSEESKGIDEEIIIIAASVGLAVIIAVIIIAVLLLRGRKRQKGKSRSENDVNDINNVPSNNESSSPSQPGGNSGHNTNGNITGAGVELSSYTYATVIPSTKRNKFKVASDDSKNPLSSSDYSEVNVAINKNPETQNGFPGHKTAQAPYTSTDTGAYSEVRDSIIKSNTPNTSYNEIDLPHNGSNKTNTTPSSLPFSSDVNYEKLHEVKRNKQNPYDTFSGNIGHQNGPNYPRKDGNVEETKTEGAVDTSTTETSIEYSSLHDIKRQEQNPYNVLPNSEERPEAASSPERFEKTKIGKTKTEHPLVDPVSLDNGDEYSRLHEIQRETQNPYNG